MKRSDVAGVSTVKSTPVMHSNESVATPGPWNVCPHLETPPVDCPCGYEGGIWASSTDEIICEMGPHGEGSDMLPRPNASTQRANARLIRAAPDMLAELQRTDDALTKLIRDLELIVIAKDIAILVAWQDSVRETISRAMTR